MQDVFNIVVDLWLCIMRLSIISIICFYRKDMADVSEIILIRPPCLIKYKNIILTHCYLPYISLHNSAFGVSLQPNHLNGLEKDVLSVLSCL